MRNRINFAFAGIIMLVLCSSSLAVILSGPSYALAEEQDETVYVTGATADGNSYSYALAGGNVTILGLDQLVNGDCKIPDTIEGHTVTSIDVYAFRENTQITSMDIPDTVTTIGDQAFSKATSLVSVHWPESYYGPIADSMFWGCSSLKEINLPQGVKSIDGWAFYNCSSLEKIEIPDTCTSIGKYAFNHDQDTSDSSLTTVTFLGNPTLTTINSYAFKDCTLLTDFRIPTTVKMLGDEAFRNCKSLTELTVPVGVSSLPQAVFKGCSSLQSLTIYGNIREMQKNAIGFDESLERIVFVGDISGMTFIKEPLENTFNATIYAYPQHSETLKAYVDEMNAKPSNESGTYNLQVKDINEILDEIADVEKDPALVTPSVAETQALNDARIARESDSGQADVMIVVVIAIIAFVIGCLVVFFVMKARMAKKAAVETAEQTKSKS